MTTHIHLKNLSKSYNNVPILRDFNLSINDKDFVTFVGPNAVGKTTVLKIMAGLVQPDSGEVLVDGLPPAEALRECKIGYVPQDCETSLFEWRTNIDNIAFPLELTRTNKANRYKEVSTLMDRFNIGLSVSTLKKFPYQLSSGEKQKVAIARALIHKPKILLMDEPFSNLDVTIRPKLQDFLLKIWQDGSLTIVFITHDVKEAAYLGSRVVVLKGRPVVDTISFDSPRQSASCFDPKSFLQLEKKIEKAILQ